MSTQGQILSGSDFATWIDNIITDYKPNVIVEIGTWKGLGSTKRIIGSIIKNGLNSQFISLETNLTFFETAKFNLKSHLDRVDLIWGRIVEKEVSIVRPMLKIWKKDIVRFAKEYNVPLTQLLKKVVPMAP